MFLNFLTEDGELSPFVHNQPAIFFNRIFVSVRPAHASWFVCAQRDVCHHTATRGWEGMFDRSLQVIN